jgi:hypothetical protein
LNDDRNKVRIYDHNLIRAGQKIGEEARVALREVDVIILLMSQEYKISSLMQREFPDLLRVREGGALLLTLYVSIFDDYNLEQITGYRRVGAEYDSLEELKPAARRRVYLELVNVIRSRLAESGRYNHLLSYVISEAK